MKRLLVAAYLIFLNAMAFAYEADTLAIGNNQSVRLTNNYFYELEDAKGMLSIGDVLKSNGFHACKVPIPVLNFTKPATWIRFNLQNNDDEPYVFISTGPVVIDTFDLYYVDKQDLKVRHLSINTQQDKLGSQSFTYIRCPIEQGGSETIYLHVKSKSSTIIPISIYSEAAFFKNRSTENIISGAFIGILVVSILYNLLLFFIVGDRSYLYYAFLIICMGLAQALLRGYVNYYIGDKAFLNYYVIPVTRVCFGFTILLFANEFLQLKTNLKNRYKYYMLFYIVYVVVLGIVFIGYTAFAYILITVNLITIASTLLVIAFYLYKNGFKPAKLFMFGSLLFLAATLISVSRSNNLIPYNAFTANVTPLSLVIGIVLFSAALAAKINFYRDETIGLQNFAISVARENERLTTQQNILLENKVKERTIELINANKDLSRIIDNLKSTQHQLVDTEKMASLGRLTAGVAHEINNPINFVSSNIIPLRLDFDELFTLVDKYQSVINQPGDARLIQDVTEYRQSVDPDFIKNEINTLLNGIEEGAKRTTEIVKSLFTFSSTDELVLKKLDINKAILANLLILRSTIPWYIQVKTQLNDIEPLNCYAGKINQMFINLIANAIHAIKAKDQQEEETITIITQDLKGYISIEITDTGTGMTDEVKERIFEPFFTTKKVGEGTGLGLSIVFGIIEKHHGSINVISSPGRGTTFIILLPKIKPQTA
jgi:signal transduction histidine kinase